MNLRKCHQNFYEKSMQCIEEDLSEYAGYERFVPYSQNVWLHHLLKKKVGNVVGKKVLDLGCGKGDWSVWLARKGATITSLDFITTNTFLVKKAAEISRKQNSLRPVTGDACNLPFTDESFDLVWGMAILHHLTEQQEAKALQECTRVLAPGGKVIFVEPLHNFKLVKLVCTLLPTITRPRRLSHKWEKHVREDPHPIRSLTSSHYRNVISFLKSTEVIEFGCLSRLDQLTGNYHLRCCIHKLDKLITPFIPLGMHLARQIMLVAYK